MTFALPLRVASPRKLSAVCLGILLTSGLIVLSHIKGQPRPWQVNEVPVAFWSWRNQAPSAADVRVVMNQTGARTIFLRAGQIDYQAGKLLRIRAVTAEFPLNVDLHLVYNATRPLLSQIESVDQQAISDSLSSAFAEDMARAEREGARVAGLQVDFDVPTRLLDRYAETLRLLRSRLPTGVQLSITGLPTWMDSRALERAFAQVNFWIPQFYGSEIPERLDQRIPISSTTSVGNQVSRARELNKPFYAGLAAFSWAMLYDPSGRLISLRGDVDPTVIAADPNLKLIDEKPFEVGEWRLQYQAHSDGVVDGVAMHAGDFLVLDLPSSASLRASARKVRELAGEKLLGICVFRLPAVDDPATLTASEIAAALQDRESIPDLVLKARTMKKNRHAVLLDLENRGSTARHLNFQLSVPAGTVQEIEVTRGLALETLCRGIDVPKTSAAQPCSQNRANVIRISSFGLRSGKQLQLRLVFRNAPPDGLPALFEAITDFGVPYVTQQNIPIEE